MCTSHTTGTPLLKILFKGTDILQNEFKKIKRRETHRQRHRHIQTDKQTDRQTDRQRQTETETERQRQTDG